MLKLDRFSCSQNIRLKRDPPVYIYYFSPFYFHNLNFCHLCNNPIVFWHCDIWCIIPLNHYIFGNKCVFYIYIYTIQNSCIVFMLDFMHFRPHALAFYRSVWSVVAIVLFKLTWFNHPIKIGASSRKVKQCISVCIQVGPA